jgi:hypothetical protein
MNKDTLKFLISRDIFSIDKYSDTFDNAITKEIMMSRKIIENGWNIGSLFNYYKGVDFTFKDKKPEDYNRYFIGDVMFQPFYNVLWNKYDLVFIKGNRVKVIV